MQQLRETVARVHTTEGKMRVFEEKEKNLTRELTTAKAQLKLAKDDLADVKVELEDVKVTSPIFHLLIL